MKLKYNFVVRKVGDNVVAVAVGADNAKFNGMINLNETGEFIFRRLMDGTDFDALVSAITEKYDVSSEEAAAAAEKFISALREGGLLTE